MMVYKKIPYHEMFSQNKLAGVDKDLAEQVYLEQKKSEGEEIKVAEDKQPVQPDNRSFTFANSFLQATDPEHADKVNFELKVLNLDQVGDIKIQEGIEIGESLIDYDTGGYTKEQKAFVIGELLASGGYGSVHAIKDRPDLIAKFELLGQRPPKEFFHEIISQNGVAGSGYVGKIKYF
jgi:hypothetical protein